MTINKNYQPTVKNHFITVNETENDIHFAWNSPLSPMNDSVVYIVARDIRSKEINQRTVLGIVSIYEFISLNFITSHACICTY